MVRRHPPYSVGADTACCKTGTAAVVAGGAVASSGLTSLESAAVDDDETADGPPTDTHSARS